MNLNIDGMEITLMENEIERDDHSKYDIDMPLGSSITSIVNVSSGGILE